MGANAGRLKERKIDYNVVPQGTRLIVAAIMHNNNEGVYPSDPYPVRATVDFDPIPKK